MTSTRREHSMAGVRLEVTGQLADTPTPDCQLADATGDFACLVFVLLAASARPRVDQSARCPVRESSSPRVGVSASCPVTRLERSVTDYKDIIDAPVLPPRTQNVVQGFLPEPDTMRYTCTSTMQTHYLSLQRFCDNVTIMFAFISNH